MQTHETSFVRRALSSSAESIVPPVAFLRVTQVLDTIFPGCEASLWRHVKAGKFPAPVKIGGRISAWRRDDVVAWLEIQNLGGDKAAA